MQIILLYKKELCVDNSSIEKNEDSGSRYTLIKMKLVLNI